MVVATRLSLAEKALLDGLVAQLGLDQAAVIRAGLECLSRAETGKTRKKRASPPPE